MDTPRKSEFNERAQVFYESARQYVREQRYFRSRFLWAFLIVIFVMSFIYLTQVPNVPNGDLQYELYGGAVGHAFANAIQWLTIPYLLLLAAEFLIRRARLSPSQNKVARILSVFVALLGVFIMIALNPPGF